jgi:hypothetical protein
MTLELATNWKSSRWRITARAIICLGCIPASIRIRGWRIIYNIVEPRLFSGQGSLVYNPQIGANGERFASFGDLSEKWSTGAEYISFFSQRAARRAQGSFFALMIEPWRETAASSISRSTMPHPGDVCAGLRRDAQASTWISGASLRRGRVRRRRHAASGRAAPGFDGGKFSPVMDAPTHCFHDWVCAAVLEAR